MHATTMRLTKEEAEILEGKQGDNLRKALESVVRFGETFEAEELVPLDACVHLVTSFGLSGAAAASNGAVGLFHVDGLTPEAQDKARGLVAKGAKTYVIDDAELERIRTGYPILWKNRNARPVLAFIGCPHLSRAQLNAWLDRLEAAAAAEGRKKLRVRTVLTTAPDVEAAFRSDGAAVARLDALGAKLSSICPLMYMNNPLCRGKAVVTCSNKLRTYTVARYFTDEEIAGMVARGPYEEGIQGQTRDRGLGRR